MQNRHRKHPSPAQGRTTLCAHLVSAHHRFPLASKEHILLHRQGTSPGAVVFCLIFIGVVGLGLGLSCCLSVVELHWQAHARQVDKSTGVGWLRRRRRLRGVFDGEGSVCRSSVKSIGVFKSVYCRHHACVYIVQMDSVLSKRGIEFRGSGAGSESPAKTKEVGDVVGGTD